MNAAIAVLSSSLLETATIESLALQKTEYDFNLVEPTGRGRGKVKPYAALELRQPVVVLLVCGVVIQDHVNFFVWRLLRNHSFKEALKVCPLLEFGDFCLHVAGAHL